MNIWILQVSDLYIHFTRAVLPYFIQCDAILYVV